MRIISAAAITEKNKLSSTGAFLALVKIEYPGYSAYRFAWNTEDVVWPSSGGDTYIGFPFEFEPVKLSSKGELNDVVVRVSNVNQTLTPAVEALDGGVGGTITFYIVHSDHLELTTAEVEESYLIIKSKLDLEWVYITLGGRDPMTCRIPKNRYLKLHCQWKEFKGAGCKYAGAETECSRSLERCRELGNVANFRGCPGISTGGVYAVAA